MARELFDSAVRDSGDLAGVFEYDGDTAYFYLCAISQQRRQRIVDSIHIFSGTTDLKRSDVAIRWDARGERVALFLGGVQWAVFNCATGRKFGGGYRKGAEPAIPPEERVVQAGAAARVKTNPHLKSYVCMHVFEHARPVLLVSRADGDWSFLCGDLHPQDASAYRVVGMGHVLAHDPDLEALLDLPADWEAERTAKGAPWIRTPLRPN